MTSIHITRELQLVIDSVQQKKAEQVTVLDLEKHTSFTDYFVICSGESEPQLKAIYYHLKERMEALGIRLHHVEGGSESGWILMDYDDFIVHIFLPEKRMFYNLERFWADAPRMDIPEAIPVSGRSVSAGSAIR